MTSKLFKMVAVVLALCLLAACGDKGPLRNAIKASEETIEAIEFELGQCKVECKEVKKSENPVVESITDGWEAYDITSTDDSMYILIVASEGKAFQVLMAEDGTVLNGMVGRGILSDFSIS